MMEKPVTTPPQFWPFLSNGIPQTFQNFNVVGLVHCGAFRKVLVVDNSSSFKKTVSRTLIWIKLGKLFWVWIMFCSSTVKIGPLFPRHNRKPTTHHVL